MFSTYVSGDRSRRRSASSSGSPMNRFIILRHVGGTAFAAVEPGRQRRHREARVLEEEVEKGGGALTKSDDVLELDRDDFPLTTLQHRLARIEEELINGRGFVRLRGIERDQPAIDRLDDLV